MKLFEPLTVGTMTLRNRIVMPAMATMLANTDGSASEQAIAYYSRRAAGGAALVTLEDTGVHQSSKQRTGNFMIHQDDHIPGLRRLARSVQQHGAKFSVQLWHGGNTADPNLIEGPLLSSSDIPVPRRDAHGGGDIRPMALTEDGIAEMVEAFGQGARRAREAGVDAVEVHAGHGYLVAQFLSPLMNNRTDRYGGEIGNRARFLLEVVARIRKEVGRDFPMSVKISGSEQVEGGITLDETRMVTRWLEDAGVDYLIITAGSRFSPQWTVQPMLMPRGCLVPFAAAIKSEVGIPVGAIGRINNPALAEQILQDGKADFVALGRALIADPDFPRKTQEGRADEIRTCTACRVCFHHVVAWKVPIRCMVNPATGRELEWKVERASEPKMVLVAGAGPAGLAAACTAAERGHRVTLCDGGDRIGGAVSLGSKPASQAELKCVLDYYEGELKRRNVEVRLGQKVTPELLRAIAPDVVVAALGAAAASPEIPMADRSRVVSERDVLADRVGLGTSAAVVGGGTEGCVTAEYLRSKRLDVVVLESSSDFATDMEPTTRNVFLANLRSIGVKLVGNARVMRIDGRKAIYRDANGAEVVVEADNIVLVSERRPDPVSVDALKSAGVPVVAVGDCVQAKKIENAIWAGSEAALTI